MRRAAAARVARGPARRRPAAPLVAAAALALALAAPAAAERDAPPCRAQVEISPERPYPGEQVRYAVLIARRDEVQEVDWVRPLRFPGLRAEWLPGRAEEPVPASRRRSGPLWWVREEHRALFAPRAGRFAIPGAVLRCRGGGGPDDVARVDVPASELRVRVPPEEGRPPGWSGLVGPLRLRVDAAPRRLRLGDSVSVSVGLRGAGNLWVARPPLAEDAPPAGAELFARPPELDLEVGEHLGVRRRFSYALVPRRSGRLEIPAVTYAWLDPETGSWRQARSDPVTLSVLPRERSGPSAAGGGDGEAEATRGERRPLRLPPAAMAAALGLLAVLAGAALWRRSAPDRRARRALAAALDRARESREPRARARELEGALRGALELRHPGLRGASPERVRRSARGDAATARAADRLEALERARFAPDAETPTLEDVATVAHSLLRRRARGREP